MSYCMNCFREIDDHATKCPYCGYDVNTPAIRPYDLSPDTILQGRFFVGRVIGTSATETTYRGYDLVLNTIVAIKEYFPLKYATRAPKTLNLIVYPSEEKKKAFEEGLLRFSNQRQIMARLEGLSSVAQIHQTFEENNTSYITMDYFSGETLASKLEQGPLSIDETLSIIQELLDSIEGMHKKNIVHLDLKPEHIILNANNHVSLIGLSQSQYINDTQTPCIPSSPYAPIELYKNNVKKGPYNDIYEIGAIMYEMLSGIKVSDARLRDKNDTLKSLRDLGLNIPRRYDISILRALNMNYQYRYPSISDFRDSLFSTSTLTTMLFSPKEEEERLIPRPLKIISPIIIITTLVFALLVSQGYIHNPLDTNGEVQLEAGMTRVPNLINTNVKDAIKQLEDDDLDYVITGREDSKTVPKDMILKQSVTQGSVVKKNTKVELTVSKGGKTIILPYVTGVSIKDAKKKLKDAGVKRMKINKAPSNTFKKGTVANINAVEGQDFDTSSLLLIVESEGISESSTKVKAPDLYGRNIKTLTGVMREKGLTLNVTEYKNDDSMPAGRILTQETKPNTKISKGSTIDVVVSAGPQQSVVPNVLYMSEAEAIQSLTDHGLKVSVSKESTNKMPAGIVMRQSVQDGTSITSGTQIAITVSQS